MNNRILSQRIIMLGALMLAGATVLILFLIFAKLTFLKCNSSSSSANSHHSDWETENEKEE